jgi:hypothetical protein
MCLMRSARWERGSDRLRMFGPTPRPRTGGSCSRSLAASQSLSGSYPGPNKRGPRARKGETGPHGSASGTQSDQRREALARREAGEALTEMARTFGVSHTTIILSCKSGGNLGLTEAPIWRMIWASGGGSRLWSAEL